MTTQHILEFPEAWLPWLCPLALSLLASWPPGGNFEGSFVVGESRGVEEGQRLQESVHSSLESLHML